MKETKEQRLERRKAMVKELLTKNLESHGFRGEVLDREVNVWHKDLIERLAKSRKRDKTIEHECWNAAYWTMHSYVENAWSQW